MEGQTVAKKNDENDPVVWMLLLERGRRTGDFELAGKAQRELAKLGVEVHYSKPIPRLARRATCKH
jgi:hypothetical protein